MEDSEVSESDSLRAGYFIAPQEDGSSSEPTWIPKKIHVPTPTETLLEKLDGWLMQQPEFLVILNAPRNIRRQAAKAMAAHILSFPKRGKPFGGV